MSESQLQTSVERKALVGGSWLALFRFAGQILSWTTTIVVARILDPSDYGLVEMAIIIPRYAMTFGDLGLGPAIIQRQTTTQQELSSIFWFSLFFAATLSAICLAVAPLAVVLFGEPRLLPLTQVVSLLFLLQGLRVVPANLMQKQLDFKRVGQIEILSVVFSCTSMLLVANSGGGAWTLICGFFALSGAQLVLTFAAVRWLPSFHCKFADIKGYLKFGVQVSIQGTLYYVADKSDKFFAGRAWNATTLGHYSMALQLAQLPSEKITVLINHVAFPTLSLLSSDIVRLRSFYLRTISVCATLVLPLFFGGYMLGADLIKLLLSDKWSSIGSIFEMLCLAQILVSLNAINNFVHNAQGRASWSSWYTVVSAVLIPLSFFLVVPYGLEAAVIPWFTTYSLLSIGWIAITIRAIGVSCKDYWVAISPQLLSALAMSVAISLFTRFSPAVLPQVEGVIALIAKILLGAAVYLAVIWATNRTIFSDLKAFRSR